MAVTKEKGEHKKPVAVTKEGNHEQQHGALIKDKVGSQEPTVAVAKESGEHMKPMAATKDGNHERQLVAVIKDRRAPGALLTALNYKNSLSTRP